MHDEDIPLSDKLRKLRNKSIKKGSKSCEKGLTRNTTQWKGKQWLSIYLYIGKFEVIYASIIINVNFITLHTVDKCECRKETRRKENVPKGILGSKPIQTVWDMYYIRFDKCELLCHLIRRQCSPTSGDGIGFNFEGEVVYFEIVEFKCIIGLNCGKLSAVDFKKTQW